MVGVQAGKADFEVEEFWKAIFAVLTGLKIPTLNAMEIDPSYNGPRFFLMALAPLVCHCLPLCINIKTCAKFIHKMKENKRKHVKIIFFFSRGLYFMFRCRYSNGKGKNFFS